MLRIRILLRVSHPPCAPIRSTCASYPRYPQASPHFQHRLLFQVLKKTTEFCKSLLLQCSSRMRGCLRLPSPLIAGGETHVKTMAWCCGPTGIAVLGCWRYEGANRPAARAGQSLKMCRMENRVAPAHIGRIAGLRRRGGRIAGITRPGGLASCASLRKDEALRPDPAARSLPAQPQIVPDRAGGLGLIHGVEVQSRSAAFEQAAA